MQQLLQLPRQPFPFPLHPLC